ncbi:hypothetical protein ABQI47_004770 [Klebsiella michiganensis]
MMFLMFSAPCAAVITKPTLRKVTNAKRKRNSMTKLNVISAVSKAQTQAALTTAARITPMTDITELAQSLKAAADREMICRDVAETSEIWERTVTPENILALVEALEKTQAKADIYDMLRDDYGLREKGVGLADFVDWQANRIAELESRTVSVKLTDINEYLADVHDKTLSLAFRRLAEAVRAGDVEEVRAAGIKVEAE